MINFEKYNDEIIKCSRSSSVIGLVDGELVPCNRFSCGKCSFYEEGACESCVIKFIEWGLSEYKEPAPILTKAERGFCEYWQKGYIARDKDGIIFHYMQKPHKKHNWWENGGYKYTRRECTLLKEDSFQFIRWEDEDPWSIEDLLKLEVEDLNKAVDMPENNSSNMRDGWIPSKKGER